MCRSRTVLVLLWVQLSILLASSAPEQIYVTRYSDKNCEGSVISNQTYTTSTCVSNRTDPSRMSDYEYKCHNLVRPTCVFLRYNCSGDNATNGRVIEMPCDICSVSSPFVHPLYYNYTCDIENQIVQFNTECDSNSTCGRCNQTYTNKLGECTSHGNVSFELVKVAPCVQRVMVLAYSEENCTGHAQIKEEVISGGCSKFSNERLVCRGSTDTLE